MEKLKKCSACKNYLSLDKFHKNKTNYDNVDCYCKACRKAYEQAYKQRPKTIILHKNCTLCKEIKPVSEFSKDLRSTTGFYSKCNQCTKQ